MHSLGYLVLLLAAAMCSTVFAEFQLSDDRNGMTCVNYHAGDSLAWHRRGGDWRDADDVSYGDRPFSLRTISRTRGRQMIEWDLTELARTWERGAGPSGGVFLRQLANQASSVMFHSRESKEAGVRPKLVIQWDNGSQTELLPSADTMMTCTSLSGKGNRRIFEVGNNRSAILVFPFSAKPGARVRKARLVLSTDKQYRASSDIGVFGLSAPFAMEIIERQGLAGGYPMDTDIQSHPAVVFATGFESSGLFGSWVDDWSKLGRGDVPQLVATDEENRFEPLFGQALKVTVKKGQKTGLNLLYRFKEKTGSEPDEMYFRYYLRFGEDWQPKVAGKMPGFAGTYGRAGWGGRKPDGTNGWSARGAYSLSGTVEDHRIALGTYAYHAAQNTKYGDVWGWNLGPTGILQKNRWYSIEQYLRLNKPGQDNGVLKAWVDGVLVFERTNILFREAKTLHIEALWMNVYHGGVTQAPSDLSLYIDNVVIATEYIGRVPGASIRQ